MGISGLTELFLTTPDTLKLGQILVTQPLFGVVVQLVERLGTSD